MWLMMRPFMSDGEFAMSEFWHGEDLVFGI